MTHGGKVKSAVPSWFVMMFLHSCSIFSDTSSEGSKPGGVDKGFVVEGKDWGEHIRQAPYRVNALVSCAPLVYFGIALLCIYTKRQ